jgi:hypothetical protein
MYNYEKSIDRTSKIKFWEKVSIILVLITIFVSLLIVVSQAAYNHQLSMQIRKTEVEVTAIKEQQNLIKARLAETMLPQQTLKNAQAKNLFLQKIAFEEIKIVSLGE